MTQAERVRLRAVVRGWVQGVGYRDFVSREARRLRLGGYVRNASDGSVEVEAEGDRPALEGFLRVLRQGPPMAEVGQVEVAWEPNRGEFGGWDLRW
ncbi:MAG: acylphosphatase [Chloroflexota bacterium]|jgi:acylphosphatase|nr:acylphosphatase [Chloroflexota bacterium]